MPCDHVLTLLYLHPRYLRRWLCQIVVDLTDRLPIVIGKATDFNWQVWVDSMFDGARDCLDNRKHRSRPRKSMNIGTGIVEKVQVKNGKSFLVRKQKHS